MASRLAQPRTAGTYARRLLVIGYLFLLVIWPVALVVQKTFDGGLDNLQTALSDPVVTDALQLTVVVALWAVAINTVFGVGISLLLVRYDFPGKRVLSTLVRACTTSSAEALPAILLRRVNCQLCSSAARVCWARANSSWSARQVR